MESLRPNPFQPRRSFEPAALQELSDSIRRHGMMHPIVVRRSGERFEIISGERRWRASQLIGLERVPVSIRESVDDREMLELALVENLQRRDLNPIERAAGFRSMCDHLGLTQEQVAERVGLQRSTVTNHLRLLELPKKVQDALVADLIQMGHARALLGVSDPREQVAFMETAVRDALSVRQVEERVRAAGAAGSKSARAQTGTGAEPSWAGALARRLSETLGTKVRVTTLDGERSQILIDCFSHQELNRIADAVAPKPVL
ncbi:MAG: ParB/RepB/Spo0J family partition protein [Planctomycetes bacterium]|nr:ParB/RepB/Spo0J family partition protein [Planctomycetota bacterium]